MSNVVGRFWCLALSLTVFSLLSGLNTGYAQGCAGADGISGIGGGVTRLQNGQVCANLDVVGPPANGGILQIQATNVFAGNTVEYRINWNDGTGFTAWIVLPNVSPGIHQGNSAPHHFPTTNTLCEYAPTTELRVNGVVCNTNFGTPPIFFRWNMEGAANSPSSAFAVTSVASPGVAAGLTNVEVCAGVATTVTFQDLSNFNCNSNPGDVTIAGNLNISRKWRQFVYGGAGASNNITGGVTVGAVPVASGAGLTGNLITYNITSGAPPGAGGGSDQPHLSGGHLNPPTPIATDAIIVPATAQIGETFIITTRFWNGCNRNDQGFAAVEYNLTRITVVGQPAAPTTAAVNNVCFGTVRSAMPTFAVTTPAVGQTVRWYANVNGASPTVPGTVGALITTTVSGAGGAASIPFSTAFTGAAGTVMPSNNYIVWATYLGASGTITCESLPRSVTRSVRTNLDLTGQTITPTINGNLCPSTAGHTYTLSMPVTPNPQPVGGNTEYVWTVPTGWTITGGQLSRTITVSLNATPSAGNVSVVWQYTSTPLCTSGALNLGVTPLITATAAAPTGTSTICQDGSTTFSSVTAGSGVTLRWQVDIDGAAGAGPFIDVPSVGGDAYTGETTNNLVINTTFPGAADQARYRLVATGTCNTATSTNRTLTIQPKASITVQPVSGPNICINGTKVFTVTAAGTATLTFQWQVDADGAGPGGFVNVPTVGGDPYTGETTASLTVNTTGTGTTLNGAIYRVNVNSTGCPSAVTSNSVLLTIQGPTVGITQGSTASVCANSNLQLNGTETFLNGAFGSRAWTGTYDENFAAAPALIVLSPAQLDALLTDGVGGSRRTALDPIFNSAGLGANKVGSYVLTLTTLDNNGCPNSATITISVTQVAATILHGPTAPTATIPGNASVCSGIDLFLDGNPSGGSGVYSIHTWTIQSQPGGAVGSISNPNIRNPVFNYTTPGIYELSYFVQDNGGCTFTTNPAGNIFITVNPLPTANDQTPAPICSDAALGTTATVNLTTLHAAINGGGGITYTWWEDYNPGTKVFSNAIGTPAAYAVTNANPVFARVLDASGCVSPATVTYTVNPTPANPTGAVHGIACDISGAAMISVADPGAGTTVLWFSNAGLTIPAGGTTSGARNQQFTPTVNSTATYFAVVQSTTAPTNCRSLGSLAVNHSQDLSPAPAANFPDFSTCDATATLTATAATNGGSGIWTVGTPVFYEAFPTTQNGQGLTGPSGAATFNHPSGKWSVIVPVGALADNTDWIRVESGRITARDVNNAEVRWESQTVVLTGAADIRADIAETGVQAAGDYVRVFYKINGGAEVQFGAINDDAVDGVFQTMTASAIGVAGNTLQIVMRARGDGATDEHWLDNVIVTSAGTSLAVITDPSNPSSGVSNLQIGPNTFTWTISSALGACAATMDQVVITRHALPAANDPAPVLCENTFGSTDVTITPAYLLTLDNTVNGGNPAHTVQYFSSPTRLPGDLIVAPFQASTAEQIYTRVTRTDVTPQCTRDGVVTFTVNPLPVANDQVFAVCEESVGSADKDNNNLPVLFNTPVTSGAANRTVAWYFDPGGPVSGPADLPIGNLIPTPNDVDNVTDGTIFYALVTNTITSCQNVASVEYDIVPRPGVNPILGQASVCKGTSLVFYQLTNVVPGSTYAWTFPPNNPGFFEIVFGGGANDAFVVLRFPNLTSPPTSDVYNISVIETSPAPSSCVGNVNNFAITVDDSPAANPIVGPNMVCKGQAGVLYQVTSPNAANTYAWSITSGDAAIVGPAAGVNRTSIIVDFGTSNSATIEVTETSPTGCSLPAAQTLIVNASDSPVMNSANAATICSGSAPSSVLTFSATLPSTFAWQVFSVSGTITTGGLPVPVFPAAGSTGVGNIGHVLQNVSGSSGTVTYLVTPTETSLPTPPTCAGPAQLVTITVQPEPALVTPQTKTICSGASTAYEIQLTPATLPAGTTFTWPAPVMSDASAQGSASPGAVLGGPSGTIHIADVLNNNSNAAITATYTITPTSGAGCLGTPRTVVITVNPEPVVSGTLNTTVCSDIVTGLTLNTNGTSVAAATWNITARTIQAGLTPGGSNALVTATGVAANYLANDQFTNTGSSSLNVTYTVIPVSAAGCAGDPLVITVTINPEPVIAATLDASVCSDNAIGLTLNTNGSSVAATSYNITARSIAGGLVAGGTNVVVPASGVAPNYLANDTYTNTGGAPLTVTYTVQGVSAATCIGDTRVITIIINPEPVVSTTLNASVCSDVATGLTLNTNGTSVSAFNYNITARTIDAGLTPAGTNVVVPSSGVAANFLASDRFTNISNAPLNVTYTVVALSAAGCVGNPQVITITVSPEPVVSNTLDLTQCSNVATGLVLNTNGTSVAAANYNITGMVVSAGLVPAGGNVVVPATGVAANYLANHAFSNSTSLSLTVSYTVVPISAAGCVGDAKVVVVTIDAGPIIAPTLDATVCSDAPVGLTLNVDASSAPAANYNITAQTIAGGLVVGGANVAVPATGVAANYLAANTYTNTGALPLNVTYTVVGVGASGCLGNPRVITMTINPEPVVSTTLNATVCSDAAIGLILNTNGTSVAALDYSITARTIDPGLIAAGTNVSVPAAGVGTNYLANDRFNNIGAGPLTVTYTVVARSAAGCSGDSRVITMTINPEPVVSGALNATVCSDVPTGLILNTNGSSVGAANYNITAITIAAGLSASAGNAVVPATGVGINYLANDVFTNTGALPLTVVYTVVPVSALACAGDPGVQVTITVNPEPVVSATLDATICSDVASGLTLNTNGSSVAAATYNITGVTVAGALIAGGANATIPAFGVAANYLANDVFTNNTSGSLLVTYTVVPVSAASCPGNSRVITITINPEPVISGLLDATVCSDAVTGLVLNTNGVSAIAASYNVTARTIDAGLTAAGTNVAVPANGVTAGYLTNDRFNNTGATPLLVTYTVVGISSSGCVGNAQVITITINPEPVVSPTLDLTQCSDIAIGLTLNTNGTSVGASTYNITARSVSAGLVVGGSNAVITASGVSANYLVNDVYTNTGATPGTVTYTVVPVSAAGCVGDSRVITITINPEPVVLSTLDATHCSDAVTGLTLNTNGTSVAAANYNITARTIAGGLVPGGGNAVVPALTVANNYLANDSFTNPTTGPLTVTYTVVPVAATGCLGDARIITMTISPEPVLSPTLNATRCSDAAIGLTLATIGTSVGAANYNITARTIDPSLIPAGTNVVVPAVGAAANYLANDRFNNITNGPLLVTYTIVPVSAGGCLGDPVVVTMTIEGEPVVSTGLDATLCSDVAVGLNLTTTAGSTPAATYNITGRTVSAGLTAAGGNAVVPATGVAANYLAADLFTNITTSSLTVTYTVVPVSAAGCVGDPRVITMTINPESVISNGLDANRCSDIATGLTITTTVTSATAATFNVTGVVIDPGLIPGGTNALIPATGVASTYLASDLFTNPGTTPLTVVYTVVPVTASGCLGDARAITITVGAEPVGVNDVKTICSDAAVTYDLQNNINTLGNGFTSNFSWVAAPNASVTGESTAPQGGPIITDVLTNVTNGSQVVVYTVTPTGTNGCVGNQFTVSITVGAEPVGVNDVASINSDIILNYDLQNNVNTLGNNLAATFSWVASINSNVGGESTTPQTGALISDVLNNVTNTNQVVTYTVIPTSVGGCAGNPFLITVTVLPEPVGFNDNVTINSDVNINYNLQNNVNSGGNALPSTFVWVAADNPLVTGESLAPVSSGSITDAITNTTGVDQVVVFTVTPTGTNGVVGNPFTITVTIRSEPFGADDTAIVCSDAPVSYNLQNNINTFGNGQASNFSWFAAANPFVTGESTTPQTAAFITDALNNVTAADQTVIYTVTPTGTNGAVGNSFQITVTVHPEPVVATNLNETQCSGIAYGKLLATNGTSIGALTYDVTVVSKDAGITGGRPLGLIGGGGSAANVIQSDSYTNTTAVPQTVVYSVVPNGPNGCIGNAQLVVFTINPEPVLFNPGFPAVCSSNTSGSNIVNVVLATNGISVAAASYELLNIQYSNGGPFGAGLPAGFTALGGNATIGAIGNIDLVRNDRFNNTLAAPVTVRYSIQGTSASGCLSAPLDYDVVINPEPVLDPALNPTPVCSGVASAVTLAVEAGSVAATTYNINSILFPGLIAGGSNTGIGNGKPANAIFNDVYVNTTSGVLTATYQITPVSAAGCVGPEGTVTLTINPSPDLANNLGRTVCTSAPATILFNTTAASVPAVTYNLISVTLQVGLVAGGSNVAPANGVAANYVSGDVFSNPTNGTLTVTYRVEPVSGATCIGPQEDIILTIEPTITAAPINHKPTVCSGSGNGNDLTDIEFVSPTNPSAGVITFNYTAVSSIGTQITGFAPALSGLAEGYRITDNLVNSSNAPATVTYTITPVAAGAASGAGCSGSVAVVVVTVEPKPRLIAPSVKTVCEGVSTAISLTSTTVPSVGTIEFLLVTAVPTGGVTGASANGTVFANGATLNDILSNPTTTAQTVTYTFRPRFNGGAGCIGDDVTSIVTVNPRPTVTPSPQPQICSGDVIDILLTTDVVNTVSTWTVTAPGTITGASSGAGDRIFQILFNSGNNIETVTYNVTPQANGCAGTVVPVNVTVNPRAVVLGTPATVTVCHGATLNVPLSSNVAAGVSYTWDVVSSGSLLGIPPTGGGNVINQPMSNTTGAQVTLTYTIHPMGPGPGAGCPGTDKIMIVNVSPEITAAWLNSPSPEFLCNNQTAFLVLNMGGRAPFNFTYNDGVNPPITQNNRPPVVVMQHVMNTTKTFTLTTVTDGLGCTTPFNVQHVVNVGDTDPTFTITSAAATCTPNEVSFRYNQVAGTIYTWRFGDTPDSVYTATTTVPNRVIKHTYENLSPSSTLNYPVTLQTELPAPFPGCFKTSAIQTVTIYPRVITNVNPNKTEICSGETISFMNSSVGTNAQTWSYRVQGQVPETAMGSSFNMNFAFTNTTTANPIVYEVIFRATNGLCPAPEVIMPIQVYRFSTANFTVNNTPPIEYVNGEAVVSFTNTSSVLDAGSFTYDWVFGPDSDPPNSTAVAPGSVRYLSPGPKDITLTVTNNARSQCKTTFTVPIDVVLPPLIARFDINPKFACFPAKVSVDTNPAVTEITGDIIEWRVLDQNARVVATSSGVYPEFTLPTAGSYTVTLRTASSQTGQEEFATPVDITVYDKPFASFDARPDVVFVPDTEMQIFNFSDDPGEVQFTWDFGDGDVLVGPNPNAVPPPAETNDSSVPSGTNGDRTKGTFEEPVHIYKVEGIYDITLITSYDHGAGVVCKDTLKQQVQARQGGVTKVPNAFTPNTSGPSSGGQGGNGSFNDVFLPIVKGADEFNLQIYDRWGNLIFESNSQDRGWDGYNPNGQLMPAGVYVYKLTVRLSDGQRSTQVGDVTMIR